MRYQKGFTPIVILLIIVILAGLAGYLTLVKKPAIQPTSSSQLQTQNNTANQPTDNNQPSPRNQNMPASQTATKTPQPDLMSPIIANIKPDSVRVGSEVTITGKNFFQNHSSVFLTPMDRSDFGDYYNNLVSHTPLPFNSDTLIKFIISPINFEYGDCNVSKYKDCNIRGWYDPLTKIPDGMYKLSVINVGCNGNNCISNTIQLTVSN